MKTAIKNKVQSLMDARRTAMNEIDAKITIWKKDTVYSDEYKARKIEELQKEAEQSNVLFNQKLNEIITQEKKAIIGEPEAKPADYQMQISNALKFIELAGSKLTDDQAFGILKPFHNDHETMNLFQAAIGKLTEGQGVWGSFQNTFGKTNAVMAIINNFTMVEQSADNLFDSQETGLNAAVRASMFMDNISTINELANAIEA